jgi:hypothetical protein
MKESQIRHCRKLGHRSRFHTAHELFIHDEVNADTEGIGAADDLEQAAGGEFFD